MKALYIFSGNIGMRYWPLLPAVFFYIILPDIAALAYRRILLCMKA